MKRRDDTDELLEEIRGLRRDVAALKGEREALREEAALADSIQTLKVKVEDLKIEKGRLTEEHAREKREVEHMVGLEKNRQKVEMEQATRDAKLTVREENLAADKDRFDKHVEFIEERFGEEVGYLKDLMGQVLGRLPTVSVDKTVSSTASRTRPRTKAKS